jgi:TPP-dependent pyruvate/acetoin dehydrogenase alpha subunit
MPLSEYVAQMFGNANDTSRGRQMSNHFQHRGTRYPSWSSVIGTQIPHGVGAAFAAKRRGLAEVHGIYFGDGATSTSGFHAGLNLAGVWSVPAVFVCMDNGWAISLPSREQSASETIAIKALAYGLPGYEVDGNDVLACHAAMQVLVDRARAGEGPSLLVPRTYRALGHSSADDPTRYRDPEEVEHWALRDPLSRFRRFLEDRGIIAEGDCETLESSFLAELDEEIHAQESVPPPPLESLVEDIYEEVPAHLRRRFEEYSRTVDR